MPYKVTTPGRVLLSEAVPEDMREMLDTPMDKKALKSFFTTLAQRHPDRYADVMSKMVDMANEADTTYGRWSSLSLEDLKTPPAAAAYREQVKAKIHKITQNPNLTPEQKSRMVVEEMKKHIDPMRKMLEEEGVSRGNALALSTRHGFRGNPVQLGQMLLGDMLIADNSGRPIPLPSLNSYSEGLSPIETFAGSYGSRQGYMCLEEHTEVRMADGGVKEIKDVQVGEWVAGSDLEGNVRPVCVLAVLDQGIKDVWRYSFRPGRQRNQFVHIDSTQEHKALQRLKCTSLSQDMQKPHLAALGEPHRTMGLVPAKPQAQDSTPVRDEDLVLRYVSKELLGERRTMDLSVDSPEHLFVLANGAVVSNSVQFSTADTGYFAKQLRLIASGQNISGDDCGTVSGVKVDPNSDEAAGRVLAEKVGDLEPGTLLTADNLKKLKASEVTVRSPRTCDMPYGICKKCAGLRPDGKWPAKGEHIGFEASGLVSEPMTQKMALSAKHTGGAVGVTDVNASGFEEVNQFFQIPENFKGAVHTEVDGTVSRIDKAPQGGVDIVIDDTTYHLPRGREPKVKLGEKVYAGDPLSDGTLNPRMVAEYGGVGEGRKYFSDKLAEILKRNGVDSHRSNIDVISRAFIGNVRVTDPDGVAGYNYGDVVPYNVLQKKWVPRESAKETDLQRATGRYLEKPVLHYSIGTRITPRVSEALKAGGISKILASETEPGFRPHVVRAAARTIEEPDWKLRLGGFYLGKAYQDMATKGAADQPDGRPSVFAGLMDPTRLNPVEGA